MQKVELNVTTRGIGKGIARKIRSAGDIPAVVYGGEVEPKSVSVSNADFRRIEKIDHALNVLINLKVDGKAAGLAMIRDYQAHPIKRNITHLDFQAINSKQKIDVEVPLVLIGEAAGIKEGGIVEQFRREIHVKAFPDKIPSSIEVDVSELQLGDNIHADELKLPEGVEFPHAVNYTVATVVAPKKVEEEVPVEAALEGEGVEGEEGAPAEGEAGEDKKEEGKE